MRKSIPGSTSSENFGEVAYDCKINMLRLNIPGAGLITGSLGFQGRQFFMPNATDTNAWTYANSFEGSSSLAHSGSSGGGGLKIGSTIPKITALQIDLTNNLTTPQQEFIVGSYFPDDVTTLTRAVSMRAAVKWENADLWRQLFNGGASETEWDINPYFSATVGSVKGFYFQALSPGMITGSQPYALRVMANNVAMQVERGTITLEAGNIIMFNVMIDVLEPASGDYIEIALDNSQTGYQWL